MAKVISCRDVGVDCDFQVRAETTDELIKKLSAHAATDHGMKEIPTELVSKVKSAIRNE